VFGAALFGFAWLRVVPPEPTAPAIAHATVLRQIGLTGLRLSKTRPLPLPPLPKGADAAQRRRGDLRFAKSPGSAGGLGRPAAGSCACVASGRPLFVSTIFAINDASVSMPNISTDRAIKKSDTEQYTLLFLTGFP
jgi:hypothetical protein